MENNEKEFYENNEDVVENFDLLNEKFKGSDWIRDSLCGVKTKIDNEDIIKEDLNPINAFRKLLIPTDQSLELISSEYEYKQRETDPYQRILSLKEELVSLKTKIDEYADRFKENIYIKETQNFSKILEELDLYKSKIDAFINYDVFNKIGDENFGEDSSNGGSESVSNKSVNCKAEFYSIFEKYNRISENLISQIKNTENEFINTNNIDFNVKYEILANPEMEMENLLNRITELEDLVTNLERTVGNWNIYNNNESISLTLTKLLNFSASQQNEKYDRKYQTFKECGTIINHFIEKKKEKLETGSYYLKIKELYAILELYEHFDQVFDYVKKRLKAIKEIYDSSDQFNNLLQNLTSLISKNEDRFKKCIEKYEETLKAFEEFESVMKELREVDNLIQTQLLK